ncbi:MAG: SRPBCC family protein [Pseudomonadota bacterium]
MNASHPLVATHRSEQALTQPNVQGVERTLSLLGGFFLLGNGLRRGGLGGWLQLALGGLVTWRGISGKCQVKQALTPSPFEQQLQQTYGWRNAQVLTRTITLNKPRQEVYDFCRNAANLPRFLRRVQSVEALGDGRLRFSASGPGGRTLHWLARLEELQAPEQLIWSTEPGSRLAHKASLHFRDAPHGRGTELQLVLACNPPFGRLGYAAATLLGKLSGHEIGHDLRRLKQLLETGEIATQRMAAEEIRRLAWQPDSPGEAFNREADAAVANADPNTRDGGLS